MHANLGPILLGSADRRPEHTALRLDERALREQVVTNIAGEWLRGDPEPASAWFEAANLPSPVVTGSRARSPARKSWTDAGSRSCTAVENRSMSVPCPSPWAGSCRWA